MKKRTLLEIITAIYNKRLSDETVSASYLEYLRETKERLANPG